MKKIYVPIIVAVLTLAGFGCHSGCGGSDSSSTTTTTAASSTGHPSGNATTQIMPPQLLTGGGAGNLGVTLTTPQSPIPQGNSVYIVVYFFGPDPQTVTVTDVSTPPTNPPLPNFPVTFSNQGSGGPWQVPANNIKPLTVQGAMANPITLSISASVNGTSYTALKSSTVSSGPVASTQQPTPQVQNNTGYGITTYSNGPDQVVIMVMDAAAVQ